MIFTWAQLWELAALAFLLFISNRISGVLGGMFHFFVSLTLMLPRVGWLFQRLLRSPFYLNAVTKPTAWMISSSGLLIGLTLHNVFWNEPNTDAEYWVLLVFAVIAILEILDHIITFDAEYYYIDRIMDLGNEIPFFKQHIPQQINYASDETFVRLARSTFVDQAISQFFRLLISIGVIYYSLASLRLIEITSSSPPTIWEAIILAFSLIDITGEIDVPLTGQTWQIVRLLSAFVSFFWLVMFITLASSSVDDAATRAREKARAGSKAWMRQILESVVAQREQQAAASVPAATAPTIKIIEALVDPAEKVDSGNETITLYNPAAQPTRMEGWKIEVGDRKRLTIAPATIGPGEKHLIKIPPRTIYLRNTHGRITLLDQHDTIIDSVEYARLATDAGGVVRWPQP